MRKNFSIKLISASLLITFSSNTIVGFGCSVGSILHLGEQATEIHIHKDGYQHDHVSKNPTHSHNGENDNCCSDNVTKIAQADKTTSQSAMIGSNRSFTAFAITYYYDINTYCPLRIFLSNKYFVRGYQPPIIDIRVSISSFQI